MEMMKFKTIWMSTVRPGRMEKRVFCWLSLMVKILAEMAKYI
jgi:hypothetical protein